MFQGTANPKQQHRAWIPIQKIVIPRVCPRTARADRRDPVIRNFVARELAIRYSLNCPPSCELRTPRSPEVHAVPKYTHSGITRSPGVHEGHELDCATQSQRYSLKSMRDVLNKDSMTAITAIRLTTTMSAMAGCATISRTQTLRTVTSMPLPASPALLSRGANVESQCSGWKSSATDPLHPNSSKINAPSGVAERPPFFVNVPFRTNAALGLSKGRFRPPSGASPMESRRLAAPNHAASVPLRGKPFAINGSSGPAA